MEKTSNPEEFKDSFMSALKGHLNEKKLKALSDATDAAIKQISSISGIKTELVEQNIIRLELSGGRNSGGHNNDGLVIYKKKHEPFLGIFPHDCHIHLELCIPTPWGDTYCVKIEAPWPCPDVVFEPGPFG